jgi:hypothetical protein
MGRVAQLAAADTLQLHVVSHFAQIRHSVAPHLF